MKGLYRGYLSILFLLAILLPTYAWTELDGGNATLIDNELSSTGQQTTEILSTGQSTGTDELALQPQIVISELFFDGNDERFELANIGQGSFSGSLTIRGVKSSDLLLPSVVLPSGGVAVFGDNMTPLYPKTFIQGSGLGLTISDSAALQVGLYFSGSLLDTFLVESSLVSSLPNNYGFEKVWSGGQLTIVTTTGSRVANISGLRVANPGVLWSGDIGVSPASGLTLPAPTTGEYISGDDLGGDVSPYVFISEIHARNDLVSEYIELSFSKKFQGVITILGLGSSSSAKTLTLDVYTGQYLVITDSLSGFLDISSVIVIDSVSLTDDGELLTILDSSGHILQSVVYTGSTPNRSRYGDESGVYIKSDYVSPGYSEKTFAYLPVFSESSTLEKTTQDSEETYYQSLYMKWKDRYYDLKNAISPFGLAVNSAGAVYRKGNSSPPELIDGTEDFVGNSLPTASVLSIVRLLPDAQGKDDGNEKISIQLLSGQSIDLEGFVIRANSKKSPLQGTIALPGDQVTFQGTFGFTNKPSCVTLENDTIVYDTFCYGQPKAGQRVGLTGDLLATAALSGLMDFDRVKKLHLTSTTGEVCALFDQTPFSCVSVKPMLDQKKVARYESKMASLQGKFEKKAYQYSGLQERYSRTKKELEMKRRKYYNQLKTVRTSYKHQLAEARLTSKIWKSYGQLLQSDLKNNREIVWTNSNISTINQVLADNLAALSGDMDTLSLHGQTFKVGDLRKQYAFDTDPALIIDVWFGQGLTYLSPEIGQKWNKRLEYWYAEED